MPTDTPESLSAAAKKGLDGMTTEELRSQAEWHFQNQEFHAYWLTIELLAAREELEQAKAREADIQGAWDELCGEVDAMRERAEAAESAHAECDVVLACEIDHAQSWRTNYWAECNKRETAEAACAALREGLEAAAETLSSMDDRWAIAREVLAQPNPGAGVLKRLRQYEVALMRLRDYGADQDNMARGSGILEEDRDGYVYGVARAALAQAGGVTGHIAAVQRVPLLRHEDDEAEAQGARTSQGHLIDCPWHTYGPCNCVAKQAGGQEQAT